MGDLGDRRAAVDGDLVAAPRWCRTDWEIWGPMGGYVASTALRAAGDHTSFARPAASARHLLGVAALLTAAIDITVTTLRKAKKAESMRVSISQGGEPHLRGLGARAVLTDDLVALTHTAVERTVGRRGATRPSHGARAARGRRA